MLKTGVKKHTALCFVLSAALPQPLTLSRRAHVSLETPDRSPAHTGAHGARCTVAARTHPHPTRHRHTQFDFERTYARERDTQCGGRSLSTVDVHRIFAKNRDIYDIYNHYPLHYQALQGYTQYVYRGRSKVNVLSLKPHRRGYGAPA